MDGKTVVIVEDQDNQRGPLQRTLNRRGFHAEGAATAKEARNLIRTLGPKTCVLVLDMRLDDPDEPGTTGADIAIEFRDKYPDWMPECLILTAHGDNPNYYKLATRLGAANYLFKEEVVQMEDVVRHVRALALKHSLRVERPRVVATLSSISESSGSLSDAVGKFSRELLAPEIKDCIGSPYLLLLTDERGTYNMATNTDLPRGYGPLYEAAQTMAHGITDFSTPHVITEQDLSSMPAPASADDAWVCARLGGASLVPLARLKHFRLSLALLVPRPGEVEYQENTLHLASLLAQYVQPSIVEHFISILVHLSSQKEARLKSISDFCLRLGQDQQTIIDEGLAARDLTDGTSLHRRLAAMAEDLWQTGIILSSASNSAPGGEYPHVEMYELVRSAAADSASERLRGKIDFEVEGSCRVRAVREEMRVAVKRLLQWLAQRGAETQPSARPRIRVRCKESEEGALIIFEDGSRRLAPELRARLFDPFATTLVLTPGEAVQGPGLSLPLYLAKVLVEEKFGGSLRDESEDMEGEFGHRLVMRFSPTPTVHEKGGTPATL
jgi:ActR/RegA family two-component response regulator